MTWLTWLIRFWSPAVIGWDDALYAAVAAYGTYSASQNARGANAANANINAFNAQQAQDFFESGNAFNLQEARESRSWSGEQNVRSQEFNAAEAQKNRDFQERMSNTQYQRAMGDMQAAGLNPMLAYSQGGAGNLGGSAASASASGGATGRASGQGPGQQLPMQQANTNTAAALMSSAQAISTVKNMDAQTENIRSQTALNEARVPQSVMETKRSEQDIKESMERANLIMKQAEHEPEKRNLTMTERNVEIQREGLLQAQIKYENGKIDMQPLLKQKMALDNALLEYDRAAGVGKYKLDTSEYGQSGGREVLKEGADLLGTVARGRMGMRGMR